MKQDGRKSQLLSAISLCQKAGKIKSGADVVERIVKDRKAYLLIAASDASKNSTEKFAQWARTADIPLIICSTKDELGRAIGKDVRSILAVTDSRFADMIQDKAVENGMDQI